MAFPGESNQILEEVNSAVKTLILNRPEKLNAISPSMASKLLDTFQAYEKDSNVKLVILKGNGKAFCSGGDITTGVRLVSEVKWSSGVKYYGTQLKLNYVLATNKKPQVSLINGIVMGGGAGLSMHGEFRVVTENAVFSMPETLLGLFPDVGSSYFLSRLAGFFGEYIGLTSRRLDAAEMVACGLATHFVLSMNLPLLEEALNKVESSDPAGICTIIDEFSLRPVLKKDSAYQRLEIINKCFSKETVEEILSTLEHEAINKADVPISKPEKWAVAAIKSLKMASPTSLKVFLRSGCRAILFDKDGRPKWDPSKLELISKEMVDQYFTKVDDEDWEDLQLPVRSNTADSVRAKL
ncbi:probable 3-hydroxyisobutyryl-CoA hydrolase 3 isoform X2 [Magnolia sinica]|uniref:probable 3-hydroxyisobutyryl-CoA hydrolase 3 isoform X2 n=1 Tax=Magnolia sinica TaxID=86752 RepID=UPI00265A1A36|nr:probable 3-hydroxyisobutyryl-CoA hydrolase 3 isoform X2 [Magnolia sinica]